MKKKTKQKQSVSVSPAEPVAVQEPRKNLKLNLEILLDFKDKAIVHPEKLQIGAFKASLETLEFIFTGMGVPFSTIQSQHVVPSYLWGIKLITDENMPFGKVAVLDPKLHVVDSTNVSGGI